MVALNNKRLSIYITKQMSICFFYPYIIWNDWKYGAQGKAQGGGGGGASFHPVILGVGGFLRALAA